MKLISPVHVDASMLTSSNIADTASAAWDVNATYAQGDKVVFLDLDQSAHKTLFESQIAGNVGNDPLTDDGTNWINIGAADRYKPFDRLPRVLLQNAGQITYSITSASNIFGIGFQGLDAQSITVEVWDTNAPAVKVYDVTKELVDPSKIVDYYTYFTWIPEYKTEEIFTDVPGYPGYRIDITISAPGGTAQVGQIALGEVYNVGDVQWGTRVRLINASKKDRDIDGNTVIVKRYKIRVVEFEIAADPSDSRRIQRVLADHLDTPALFFAGADLSDFGTSVYGYADVNELPLEPGTMIFSVRVEEA